MSTSCLRDRFPNRLFSKWYYRNRKSESIIPPKSGNIIPNVLKAGPQQRMWRYTITKTLFRSRAVSNMLYADWREVNATKFESVPKNNSISLVVEPRVRRAITQSHSQTKRITWLRLLSHQTPCPRCHHSDLDFNVQNRAVIMSTSMLIDQSRIGFDGNIGFYRNQSLLIPVCVDRYGNPYRQ